MRGLFAFVTSVVASADSEEEVGLLQQRLSVGEGIKSDAELDMDCRQGPKNCVKKSTTTTTTIEENPSCGTCPRGMVVINPDLQCSGNPCSVRECCTRATKPATTTPATTTPKGAGFEDTEPPTQPPATKPPTTVPDECRIWGDPQVTSFDRLISAKFTCNGKFYDETEADSYKDGDYYLLKSSEIEVQGRFGAGMGTTRSMGREVAINVGSEIMQIKPHSIWYRKIGDTVNPDGTEVGAGDNAGLTSGSTIGKFKVVPFGSGLVVMHKDVSTVKVWMQQVGNAAPAVQTVIYKKSGALTDLSGLCGNADGVTDNDCTEMIGGANKVEKDASFFMAAPFDFAGCATAADVQWEWRTMGACSNADTCALKCKGFGAHLYYPEFYVKKSVQIADQVDCYCANLEASQTTAWARFAMKPSKLKQLAPTSGTCSAAHCADIKSGTKLGATDYCVFKEKAKAIPKVCTAAEKESYTVKCTADDKFTGNAIIQCVSDMCASDDPDGQETTDGDLMVELNKESVDIAAAWESLSSR